MGRHKRKKSRSDRLDKLERSIEILNKGFRNFRRSKRGSQRRSSSSSSGSSDSKPSRSRSRSPQNRSRSREESASNTRSRPTGESTIKIHGRPSGESTIDTHGRPSGESNAVHPGSQIDRSRSRESDRDIRGRSTSRKSTQEHRGRSYSHVSTRRHPVSSGRRSKSPNSKNVSCPVPGEKDDDRDVIEISVDEDLVNLLGDAPMLSPVNGPDFHKHIAERWGPIAQKGLPQDERNKLKTQFATPGNCEISGSKLNPELCKAVPPYVRDSDDRLKRIQDHIAVSATAIGNLMTNLLSGKEIDTKQILSDLSSAGRYLVGTQYCISLQRRRLVSNSIKDSSMKSLLSDTPIYPYLFGADLSTQVNAASKLTKVGNDLSGRSVKTPATYPRSRPSQSQHAGSSRVYTELKKPLNFNRPLPTSSKDKRSGQRSPLKTSKLPYQRHNKRQRQ